MECYEVLFEDWTPFSDSLENAIVVAEGFVLEATAVLKKLADRPEGN